jgi:CheY-like chemotaxis protein
MAQTRTILLVEDNPGDVVLARLALKDLDPTCELQVSEDGADAMDRLLEAAEHGSLPDLVILDMALPRLDGKEVLRQIRNLDSLASLRVAILSGSRYLGDEAELRALGADAFLSKSLDGPPRLDLLLGLLGPAG